MSSNDDDRCGGSAREDRERRQRIAQKHARAAADGLHLPSVKELLLGSPWLSKDILADAKLWAERILPRIDRSNAPGRIVGEGLDALIVTPSAKDFLAAAMAARRASDPGNFVTVEDFSDVAAEFVFRGPDIVGLVNRLDVYAAATGSSDACVRIAQVALIYANDSSVPVDEAAKMAEAALGWLAVARDVRPVQLSGRGARYELTEGPRNKAQSLGNVLVNEILRANELLGEDLSAKADDRPSPRGVPRRGRGTMAAARVLDIDCDRDEIVERGKSAGKGVIVIPHVGNVETHEGKRIAETYKPVVGVRLPLPPVPDLASVRSALDAEFPHATTVTAAILSELEGREFVRLRPTILVGSPGCAKTTYATRLLKALGIANQIYPCAGVADSNLGGTPRQWSTGTPSVCVSLMARFRTAAPGIVLDELEKVAESRRNGSLLEALLAMLEPVSSVRWLDPMLQSECDLSHVIWIGTVNSLDGVPAPLRDRCRTLRFPNPSAEHLPVIGNALLRKAIQERGLPEAWALPLDHVELGALSKHWEGGSIRRLSRLIDGVLSARDQPTALS